MNLISHICWLLILHLPVYSPAPNHAESSFRFGPDYEYKYGTVPERKDNRKYHLREYDSYPPTRKSKIKGRLFDHHPGYQITDITPRPLKPPPPEYDYHGKSAGELTRTPKHKKKPNEYDSNESVDNCCSTFRYKLTTTHRQRHHADQPQINTEEDHEDDTAAPKKKENHIEKKPDYEKHEEESPEGFPVTAEKIIKDNNLLQFNTEEEYPESSFVAPKNNNKPHRPSKSKPNTKSTTLDRKWRTSPKIKNKTKQKKKKHGKPTTEPEVTTQAPPTTTTTRRHKKWWEKIEDVVNSWLGAEK